MAAAASNEPRINDRIRAREVRLVSYDGEQIGIRPLPEALGMAREAGLDLVEVADKADPPVCRIMDYGKFKYEAAQRAKESRRNSTNVVIKEMKYRPKIGSGDFDTKTRKVKAFLEEGNKVKLTIMFRGREMQHPELGRRILDHVAEEVEEIANIEAYPKLDGRNMVMVLAPDKQALERRRRAEQREAEAAAQAAREAESADSESADSESAEAESAEAGEAGPGTDAGEAEAAELGG